MADTVRMVLELEQGSDPVVGHLQRDGGPSLHFDGYVQLIGLLETINLRSAEAPEPTTERGAPDAPTR